ncbi:SRPBCC family protein [Neobacillus sp. PS3-40]|uniref:CoxG family protein n=1 Tax=Neobacillus sp. PS3-40 TaxID=3070679 RepID=UPI0027E1FC15|nr:SRPBCC family protein [Neobacillus sp. PS3-40]WML45774.1 SRPBCC family protein [Neobacillus sp. PS3-40]
MPSGMHQVELDLPIEDIWAFVKNMDNWAPLVPGYIRHKKFNNRQSTWEFFADIGIMKKKVSLMVTIKEWIEPTKVTFDLKGLEDNFAGKGYFEAVAIEKNKTRMTGYLDIIAEGIMGRVINNVLKTSVPELVEELTENIAAKLK